MKVDYNLREKDYIEYNMDDLRNSKGLRKLLVLQKALIAFFLGLILYLILRRRDYNLIQWFVIYSLALLITSIMELLFLRYFLKNKLRRDLENNPRLIGRKTLAIKREGLYELSEFGTRRTPWDQVKFIEAGRDYIYIFTTEDYGYIIPRRYFKDEASLDSFIRGINNNIE